MLNIMETSRVRTKSLNITASAGLSILATLPVLEDGLQLRSQADAFDRMLCLHSVVAASFGFDKAKSLTWLRQEQLETSLTDVERHFLERGEGQSQIFHVKVEAMWALAWALNLVPQLDFWKDCDGRFVAQLPNLKVSQSSDELRRKAKLQPADDVVAACDLAYCLHWAIRQAEIEGKQPPAGLKSYVVVERRRALEWLLGSESWDSVSLDT